MAQVVELEADAARPAPVGRLCGAEPLEVPVGEAPERCDELLLAAAIGREGADGPQQAVAGRPGSGLDLDERAVDERQQPLGDHPALEPVAHADDLGRLEVEGPREHGQAPQDRARRGVQQVVAPVEQTFERALALGQRNVTALQHGCRTAQPLDDVRRPHDRRARGRELDRQRQPVELGAELDHGGVVIRLDADCPVAEEPHRRRFGHVTRERVEAVHALRAHAQRHTAGRQYADARAGVEQLRHARAHGFGQVLAVVDHEQRAALAQVIEHLLGGIETRHRLRSHCARDRFADQLGRGDGRELHEPDAVLPLWGNGERRLDRHAGLAGAAGADDGRDRAGPRQLHDRGEVLLAPFERRGGPHEVVSLRRSHARRCVPLFKTGRRDAVQLGWVVEVPHAEAPEAFERDALGQRGRPLCGVAADEHLPTVGCVDDSRRLMQREGDVGPRTRARVAAVDPDSHPHRRRPRPRLGRQRALRRHGGGDGVVRGGERDEEGVALRLELVAVVLPPGIAQQGMVPVEDLLEVLAQFPQQPRRSLDVSEEERHDARGQIPRDRHGASFPQCLCGAQAVLSGACASRARTSGGWCGSSSSSAAR